ncbi:hypothetical protein HMPREF0580_1646 [Mobiluncus mulieris ATCC 35239]|uniref:Uncharacterized protein n=2 Tax=Mobiluncus mulieris TaxID=2052 RepID=E0QRY1_9ACTO|nr:hypothetical protein HMPREF0577_0981 [Mobiluncus mulieris ATCC 35243]EFM45839.1 hypothetical protein HMPREF0580_1646 [Mobiluncus mulieris ATCC 35239]MCU9970344.1 RNA polymerase subunit sigma-24 [Mobiluncus mulieris]MCU9994055.1 RNA polymerase subunit sigma-24 [Mobiluncus mulieris]MCV0003192.1 RNA polymerase subunit sigma-24 [Mobiluncus mulieris]
MPRESFHPASSQVWQITVPARRQIREAGRAQDFAGKSYKPED